MAIARELGKEEFFAPGHRACPGCGETIATRLVLKALGGKVIIISATGCLEIISSSYPQTAWRVPWCHVAFENTAAVASGVEAALKAQVKKRKRKDEKINVVAVAGDGGTFDIGLQSLSGMMERGHDVLYICFDNEAYMNTGIQRSSATPFGAWTTTTTPGKLSVGNYVWKKNMPAIAAAHNIPYIATASLAYPLDLARKVKKGAAVEGPAYIQILTPCIPGWRMDNDLTIEISRLATQTGYYPLYEIENGKFTLTISIPKRKPIVEFLKLQGRFRHLTEKEITKIQGFVDAQCKQLGIP
ncbi:MAG TPA: pyruvate synthase subunit PorB [archaeon]|nr:pyruvate synthase subunit PorB [archaeon]